VWVCVCVHNNEMKYQFCFDAQFIFSPFHGVDLFILSVASVVLVVSLLLF
jgi:hypothetical protein